jgi:hypothetical protein
LVNVGGKNVAKTLRLLIISFLKTLFGKYLEDLFILGGLIVIIGTTYTIDPVIANYVLGGVLVICGLLIAKKG